MSQNIFIFCCSVDFMFHGGLEVTWVPTERELYLPQLSVFKGLLL